MMYSPQQGSYSYFVLPTLNPASSSVRLALGRRVPVTLGTGFPAAAATTRTTVEPGFTALPDGGWDSITLPAATVSLAAPFGCPTTSPLAAITRPASSILSPATGGTSTPDTGRASATWMVAPCGASDPASGFWPEMLPGGRVESSRSSAMEMSRFLT